MQPKFLLFEKRENSELETFVSFETLDREYWNYKISEILLHIVNFISKQFQ